MPLTDIQQALGVNQTGVFDAATRQALEARLTNLNAPRLSNQDYQNAASTLGVPVCYVEGVARVESGAYGSFDRKGRPTILYEPHVFSRNSGHRFDRSHPHISARRWNKQLYARTMDGRYNQLFEACSLDIDAALEACSYGLFQVLGENWQTLQYTSPFELASLHAVGEPAQLDALVRYITGFSLVDELQACQAGDPASCVPFVRAYNGKEYYKNDYHVKLARAIC